MPGKAALRRNQKIKKAKRKELAREQAKLAAPTESSPSELAVPFITEHDLLAFQHSHFGDDTKPETWFVAAEEALNFEPKLDEEEDDLGLYEDGVRRTLTDEQIEMFRHSEMIQLIREGTLPQDEFMDELLSRHDQAELNGVEHLAADDLDDAAISEASSVEEELIETAARDVLSPSIVGAERQGSQSAPSLGSSNSSAWREQRAKEIPYEERKKRKWEGYIEDKDPEHGSRTHRRIVRELDAQRAEDVELEY